MTDVSRPQTYTAIPTSDRPQSAGRVYVFGLPIINLSVPQAVQYLEQLMTAKDAARCVFIANAHTLNLAYVDPGYYRVLGAAHAVLADGTGLRWAARGRGRPLRGNLVGTDLVPALFRATAGRGYSVFLLGADRRTIDRAAGYCRATFPGWRLAGWHHGYLSDPVDNRRAVDAVNASGADLLLVGMGNPLQERWLHDNLRHLRMPLGVGVGGLFDHWGGNLRRAPLWVRKLGCEWVQLLLQDHRKARRYLLGNPQFVWRMTRERGRDRALMADQR